jgi:hypothetical protein
MHPDWEQCPWVEPREIVFIVHNRAAPYLTTSIVKTLWSDLFGASMVACDETAFIFEKRRPQDTVLQCLHK